MKHSRYISFSSLYVQIYAGQPSVLPAFPTTSPNESSVVEDLTERVTAATATALPPREAWEQVVQAVLKVSSWGEVIFNLLV
jgi:hypothetical protein